MYDVHSHFIPEDVMDWLKDHQTLVHAKWEQKEGYRNPFLTVNGKWGFELKPAFVDKETYMKEQKENGLNHTVVSPVPQLFLYDFPAEITHELGTVYNRALAQWVSAHPQHLSALATLSLNRPETAAEELEKAMASGLKGAIIGPGWQHRLLSDDGFTPLWESANRLGAIFFIHPLLNEDPRLQQKMMPNLIGVPWETTICAADLILNGVLDRYPNVKILLAHGGGFLPYQIGRLDKGYERWPAVSSQLRSKPGDVLKKFWFDTVLWNPAALEYLVRLVGEERVVPGSDYPFDLCSWPPSHHMAKGFSLLFR